ncbi:putative transposase [Streptomyces sp. B4I13]|nr:putative transposase [Streptomyces sp. B4I13]
MGSASLSYKGHRYPIEVTRRCDVGAPSSGGSTRAHCAAGSPGRVTSGTWTRSSSRLNGDQKYLWRAVDQDGDVLDILVQNRRDKAAARRFFSRLMKKRRTVPRVIVTDKLRSYSAARREVMPSLEHRQSKYLNNRAENSHQPTRQRERAMKGFRSVGGAQRFLSAFSGVSPHFRPRRHLMPAHDYRAEMTIFR